MLRVLPADLLVQRWLLTHLHYTLRSWLDCSIGETHLRQMLLELLLMHLVFRTRVVFIVLYVLDVLNVCIQVINLNCEINID